MSRASERAVRAYWRWHELDRLARREFRAGDTEAAMRLWGDAGPRPPKPAPNPPAPERPRAGTPGPESLRRMLSF